MWPLDLSLMLLLLLNCRYVGKGQTVHGTIQRQYPSRRPWRPRRHRVAARNKLVLPRIGSPHEHTNSFSST